MTGAAQATSAESYTPLQRSRDRVPLPVVETAILPWSNSGIAHRQAGVGQIGAGVMQAPPSCFVQALEAFATGCL